jgi:hypothetical protein
MTEDEYLAFVEQIRGLFPDLEPRRRIDIKIALL